MCQLCMVEPVDPSKQEHEVLKKDNEQLVGENQRLSEVAARAAASATYWERRAIRAEEILDAYAKQAGRAGGRASKPRWLKGAR